MRVLIVAGEPGGSIPATRARIEQSWGARVIDHHGLTEVGPLSFECWEAPGFLHVNEGEFICEVLDPLTGAGSVLRSARRAGRHQPGPHGQPGDPLSDRRRGRKMGRAVSVRPHVAAAARRHPRAGPTTWSTSAASTCTRPASRPSSAASTTSWSSDRSCRGRARCGRLRLEIEVAADASRPASARVRRGRGAARGAGLDRAGGRRGGGHAPAIRDEGQRVSSWRGSRFMATTGNAEVDVVVIGGGPAGSTVSTLIAQQGPRVALFERERFPRFHIGESLIPETYWVLKRLNMLPKMQASHFVKKYSVQFVNSAGRESAPFYFWDNKPHECSQTWQVVRSEFDQMMLDNAREHGVDAHEGVRVLEVLFEGDRAVGVTIKDEDGDASRGAGEGRRRCQRPERAADEPAGPARVGSDAEQGRDLDLLEGRLPRHRPRRRRDAGHPDRQQEGLVLVHPAARRHRQRRRRRAVRLPVQGPHELRADLRRRGRATVPA